MGLPVEDVTKALLAAGMIGIFIARHATFAAESGGCQAECGAASGMAAAALISLAGGSVEQSLAASSLALQNSLGMICDPIANRVEAPCLGKNVMAAMNALSCANMALAGYQHLIPLDEVIRTMDEVGASLPRSLRCTALGGLSITPAARRIEKALKNKPIK
jgi:L-serine dehydratase